MKTGVFATVDEQAVEALLGRLTAAGFSDSRVSVLIPFAREPRSLSLSQDVRHGAVTGSILGMMIAEFGTLGTLMLAGVGSFVVAGPLLFAIGGAAVGGAAVGGVIGGLAAGTGDLARIIGLPRSVVEECEEELKEGRGLVFVEFETGEEKARARRAFAEAGVSRIHENASPETPRGVA